jgi:hypothetical protein
MFNGQVLSLNTMPVCISSKLEPLLVQYSLRIPGLRYVKSRGVMCSANRRGVRLHADWFRSANNSGKRSACRRSTRTSFVLRVRHRVSRRPVLS